MNEFLIYLEDITPSPGYLKGWRIFKIIAVILGPKILSKLVFEAKIDNVATFKLLRRLVCIKKFIKACDVIFLDLSKRSIASPMSAYF